MDKSDTLSSSIGVVARPSMVGEMVLALVLCWPKINLKVDTGLSCVVSSTLEFPLVFYFGVEHPKRAVLFPSRPLNFVLETPGLLSPLAMIDLVKYDSVTVS